MEELGDKLGNYPGVTATKIGRAPGEGGSSGDREMGGGPSFSLTQLCP